MLKPLPLSDLDACFVNAGNGIGAHEAHVWILPLCLPELDFIFLKDTLDKEESRRASRFQFEPLQRNFEACRGLLRYLIGKYAEIDPGSVRFKYGDAGKPELAEGLASPRLHFNVSHCGNWALMAFSRSGRVGADIEQPRPLADTLEIARTMFSADEWQRLCDCSPEQRTDCFYATWTMKEAVVKALGVGIGFGMGGFDVPDHAVMCGSLRPLRVAGELALSVGRFRTRAGLHCAVCVESDTRVVKTLSPSGAMDPEFQLALA